MKAASLKAPLSWAVPGVLLVLLVSLATLQYRWLDTVSAAQRERGRADLERSARLFAEDFDRELTRIFVHFQPLMAPYAEGGDVLRAWVERSPYPALVGDVLKVEPGGGGELALARYDRDSGELGAVPWPPELAGLRRRLGEFAARPPGPPPEGESMLDGEVPAVLIPLFGPPRGPRGRTFPGEGWRRGDRERFRGGRGVLVVRLDPAAVDEVLTQLAERHFGADGALEFHLRVIDRRDPQRVIFEAGPALAGAAGNAGDATRELFGFLPFDDVRGLVADAPSWDADAADGPAPLPGLRGERRLAMTLNAASGLERRWRLIATHPSGSLEAVVAAARRRNLAISLGILLLLGTTVLMLLAATRRAQRLARQQLEFVAGVTHELRTPLAAMRSAGQNLAAGVVRDDDQVERYGALIEREGRRLTDMVEQVLEYAGIQSGQRTYHRERTSLAAVVESALAEWRPRLEEKGFAVESEVAADLPAVEADVVALRHAVGNLIGNAAKYGAGGAWIAVRAQRVGSEARIAVADRGPGIAREDLARVFEPFFRGRGLAAGRTPGSGLGLSLVRHICEAHGGRVSVESRDGQGATFTLHLPAAPPAGEPAST